MALQRDHSMALFRRLKTPFMEDLPDGEAAFAFGPRSAGDLLRQQREALGLDLDDVSAALDAKPDLTFPIPLGERSIPGGSMLLVALILALCGYGTWYYVSTSDRSRPVRVIEVPPELAAPPPRQPAGEPPVL